MNKYSGMKKMKSKFNKAGVLVGVLAMIATTATQAADIEPPRTQLTDRFGVNMANGQVSHSMGIVSIGGAMGLSDSISIRANEFDFIGYRGFNHKYYAQARDVTLTTSQDYHPHRIMRVYDSGGSADFAYYVNGVLANDGEATAGITYVALGDERNTLEASGHVLDWTKPDGTVVRFTRGVINPHKGSDGGGLSSITYPNGLIITVDSSGISVRSNTGWQLKRFYSSDTRYCNASPYARTSSESGWALSNPTRVVGINSAINYCAPFATTDTAGQGCALTKTWPTATFTWPACMPDIMFRQNEQIGVTSAEGVTTNYKFTRYDLALKEDGSVADGFVPGQQFSPRLTAVSAPNSTADLFTYGFKNLFMTQGTSEAWMDVRLQKAGVVTYATHGAAARSYDWFRPYYSDVENIGTSSQGDGVFFVRILGNVNGGSGVINYADTDEGRIEFEQTPRNNLSIYRKTVGLNESYGYSRGNVIAKGYFTAASSGFGSVAEYPTACTPTTRKTCNQPTRTRDPNGNWTDYEYHAASGQVSKVTLPADKTGVRAQSRYYYSQLSAHYYDSNGSWITGSPIWLKTSEEYCIKSAASGNDCAVANDEVVTSYEYNHNNLLLTGVTVTAPGSGTRRTCYRYDVYGNQIGVTTPNANLGSCP
jgi:YD repeat-containing protein